jgi:hypothetical protein
MTRRGWWTAGFLGITTGAVAAELVAALDNSPDTIPWTEYLTDLPWWVTMPAALTLSVWLPLHLAYWYRRRAGQPPEATMTTPTPDPNATEPLLTRAGIVAAVTIALDLLVLFVHIDEPTRATILAAANIAAPLVLAVWARRAVFSPATVSKMLTTRR